MCKSPLLLLLVQLTQGSPFAHGVSPLEHSAIGVRLLAAHRHLPSLHRPQVSFGWSSHALVPGAGEVTTALPPQEAIPSARIRARRLLALRSLARLLHRVS
jgi:hypothetical protein